MILIITSMSGQTFLFLAPTSDSLASDLWLHAEPLDFMLTDPWNFQHTQMWINVLS